MKNQNALALLSLALISSFCSAAAQDERPAKKKPHATVGSSVQRESDSQVSAAHDEHLRMEAKKKAAKKVDPKQQGGNTTPPQIGDPPKAQPFPGNK